MLTHQCRPPGCPGTHVAPDLAEQLGYPPSPPCRLLPFTCRCGREWVVCGPGWEPKIQALIERSSLGTPEAKMLRRQTPRHVTDEIMRRVFD